MHDAANSRLSIKNRILSALPAEEYEFLRMHLELVSLPTGTVLAHAGERLRNCYFPENGMVSLLSVTENGHAVEAAYAGFEGMVGLPVIFGKNEMPYQALIQAPTDLISVKASKVAELFKRNGTFHDLVLRFAYVIIRQMGQTCVCNHFHPIQARLCRWLSVMCERSGNSNLALTQEFLAHMLGVQRTSIGMIAVAMQREGIIRYRRGKVEIIDPERLKREACECYSIVQQEYRELLADKKFRRMSETRQTFAAV